MSLRRVSSSGLNSANNTKSLNVSYTKLTSKDVSGTTGSPTITTSGTYTIYSFTGTGSITFSRSGIVDQILVVGAGGSGGYNSAAFTPNQGVGGAGGGQVREISDIFFQSGAYTVTVGAGATAVGNFLTGQQGGYSSVGTILSIGGGSGGSADYYYQAYRGRNGGNGGGFAFDTAYDIRGISITGDGYSGGIPHANGYGGGGGGAGGIGGNSVSTPSPKGGGGGIGKASSITGSSVTYGGGGGGGGGTSTTGGTGGTGGGGNGGSYAQNGAAGTANTGGGGGGAGSSEGSGTYSGGSGGSGIVIVRVIT